MTHILLVESSSMVREALCAGLENAGYTVISATNFDDGNLLLTSLYWHALVTAVDLDGLSGSQLAAAANIRKVPTVFIAENIVPLAARRTDDQASAALVGDVAARVRALVRVPATRAA
jgi:DNA-binding response OmpR family regulator